MPIERCASCPTRRRWIVPVCAVWACAVTGCTSDTTDSVRSVTTERVDPPALTTAIPIAAVPATTTSISPITTVSRSSTTSLPTQPTEDPRINQWALAYVGGRARAATGVPFRIGFASGTPGDIDNAKAAVDYLNAQLGGVGGRPLELDVCDATSAATLDQQSEILVPCGRRLAADPTIPLVLIGDLFSLDTQFTAIVGATKPIYVAYGYQNVGISYNPNGVETLAAAVQLIASKFASEFDRLIAIDPVAVSGFIKGVLPEMQIIDVPFDQFEATTVEQAVAAIAASGATSNDLFFIQAPDCGQIVEALRQLALTPTVVAGGGCGGVALDGWYKVNLGWNPDAPAPETGALTASVKVQQYQPDTWDGGIGAFADVLTIAMIINTVGVDAATPETLRAALAGFTGTAMLARGPANCADPSVLGFPLGNCATVVDAYQRQDGVWVEIEPIVLEP